MGYSLIMDKKAATTERDHTHQDTVAARALTIPAPPSDKGRNLPKGGLGYMESVTARMVETLEAEV